MSISSLHHLYNRTRLLLVACLSLCQFISKSHGFVVPSSCTSIRTLKLDTAYQEQRQPKFVIHANTESSSSSSKETKNEEQSVIVDQLVQEIEIVQTESASTTATTITTERANKLLDDLIESSSSRSNNSINSTRNNSGNPDFDALIGYYNVSYTKTARDGDNPVGGKWTRSPKFWNIKRTLQHILPVDNTDSSNKLSSSSSSLSNIAALAVAQAVNVIRLDVLGGIIPIWIVLRGDAVPLYDEPAHDKSLSKTPLLPNLTNRAVRVYFDRPRIAIGKFAFSLGPTSSVVIDTPYVDDRLRIGIGGTSGTKFVFRRLVNGGVKDYEATDEWKWLLNRTSQSMITQRKLSLALSLCVGFSGWFFWKTIMLGNKISSSSSLLFFWRCLGGLSTLASTVGLLSVLRSTGGIETDSDTYARGK